MKRLIVVSLALLLLGNVVGVAVEDVNTVPPPGFAPRAWACYETCVLPNYIVADDFNMNGWFDLAVSCVGNSVVNVYNNANGIFNTGGSPVSIGVGAGPAALITGHIAFFDGYPDIGVLSTLTAGSGWQPVQRILNSLPVPAAAVVNPNPPALIPGLPVNNLVHMAGDYFDNNNLLDIAVVESAVNLLHVFESGAWTWLSAFPLALPGSPVFISTADFDQDGWTDIAVLCANVPATVSVFYNSGAIIGGTRFTPANSTVTALWAPLLPTGMDVGDFNEDGYPDLVVVGNAAGIPVRGYAQVLLNNVPTIAGSPIGLHAVTPAMQTWGFDTRFVEVADYDGNGRDDFATANYESDTVTVFLTDSLDLIQDHRPVDPDYCLCEDQRKRDLLLITFKLFKIELQCGHFPIGLAAGDFDRNGKMDLAVALQSADDDLCAQNPSCIEIDFDIACDFNGNQRTHRETITDRGQSGQESLQCIVCKDGPCAENSPPTTGIETEGDSKNP